MKAVRFWTAAVLACASAAAWAADVPGTGEDAGKTVIYRDTWGVPHIYAPTAEAGLYAMGYAMADDRPEELLKNFLRGLGETARFRGAEAAAEDLFVQMFDHYGLAKADWETTPAEIQAHVSAFVDGINAFYDAHPEDRPAWWGDRRVDVHMVGAYSRLFLVSWSIDQALEDLKRSGVEPGTQDVERGSNQWAIAPERTADGDAILYIDPHLSWWGASRFWELRIHAGSLVGSGFSLPGNPYIGLGHNARVAWAMTTGGPDTADVFEVTLNAANPNEYLYDGEWKAFESREVTLHIKDVGEKKETVLRTIHGPVVAMANGKAYAVKTAYADAQATAVAWHALNHADGYKGVAAALDTVSVFPQNVMAADVDGNIYYQRTGRVPKRAAAFNYDFPVNGSTSASQWLGIHPASDLIQILNPPTGYMQNCNIPPSAMYPNAPYTVENTIPYIYADREYGPSRDGWNNERGARAVELLGGNGKVTVDEALAYANDTKAYGAERWLGILRYADKRFAERFAGDPFYIAGIGDLLAWDGMLEAGSTGALKYAYWREEVRAAFGDAFPALKASVDNYFKPLGKADPPVELTEEDLARVCSAFGKAMARLAHEFGKLDAAYGDRYRVGRDDVSWPVGGGGNPQDGLRALRSVGFGGQREDYTQWGQSGQTSTQVVVLSEPIQSWTYAPIGQSDRPDSPHYRDQAEKAFSPKTLKDTWWTPEALADHIASRTVLENAPAGPDAAPPVTAETPEAAIEKVLATWANGLVEKDVTLATSVYAGDYSDDTVGDLEQAKAFLQGMIEQGYLDGVAIDRSGMSLAVDGERAVAKGIQLTSAAGGFDTVIELAVRDGAWRITRISAQ